MPCELQSEHEENGNLMQRAATTHRHEKTRKGIFCLHHWASVSERDQHKNVRCGPLVILDDELIAEGTSGVTTALRSIDTPPLFDVVVQATR